VAFAVLTHNKKFVIFNRQYSTIQTHCAILHPLPRRYEIEIGIDKDSRAATGGRSAAACGFGQF
jgi:aspartate carbamoyltransferase catalytic subunit